MVTIEEYWKAYLKRMPWPAKITPGQLAKRRADYYAGAHDVLHLLFGQGAPAQQALRQECLQYIAENVRETVHLRRAQERKPKRDRPE